MVGLDTRIAISSMVDFLKIYRERFPKYGLQYRKYSGLKQKYYDILFQDGRYMAQPHSMSSRRDEQTCTSIV